MSQKSILSYFGKVTPKAQSPTIASTPNAKVLSGSGGVRAPTSSANGKSNVTPTQSSKPISFSSSSNYDTPKGSQRQKGVVKNNRNGKAETPQPQKMKKRRTASPDSAEVLPNTQKRRKIGQSPNVDSTPVSKCNRRFSRILIQDDSDDEAKDHPMDTLVGADDTDDDYKPDKDTTFESDKDEAADTSSASEDASDEIVSTEDEEDEEIKPRGGKRRTSASTAGKHTPNNKKPEVKKLPMSKTGPNKSSLYDTPAPSPRLKLSENTGLEVERGSGWPYLSYVWLKDDRIMDKNKRRPDHPDYDPKTLFIPKDFLDKCTPASRQWWEMKSSNFDTILFFKMGKFYELYHMDAVIAVQELGFVFMKGEHAHCGFPEIAYAQNAEVLVERGYKVARCEQTETPDMMNIRIKGRSATKFEKVVRREICQVTTKGIRLASAQDDRMMPFHQNSEYLYAIVERTELIGSSAGVEYGVCFIDTTIGTFHIGQFKDDRYCSRIRTLFSHYAPVQILQERGKGSFMLDTLLRNLSGVRIDTLVPETEFWSCQKTLKVLAEGDYFRNSETGNLDLPESLQFFLSKNDSLGLTPGEGWDLGLKCLGAVISYLTACLVEHDILTFRSFTTYSPLDADAATSNKETESNRSGGSKYMVLDGSTLRNLEVTEGPKCLLSYLDKCATSFGKRLLRYWTCVPLCDATEIKLRQDAIEELIGYGDLTKKVVSQLKTLLDLERLLGKIHTFGSIHRSQEHPDSRASFFEEKKYSKRKITDLVSVLKSFKTTVDIINAIKNSNVGLKSGLLISIVSEFPDLQERLQYFDEAFDHKTAMEAGNIKPVHGKVKEYDAAFEAIEDILKEAEDYLNTIRKMFRVSKICYFGSDKKRFQIEVPENVSIGKDFDLSSTRKGFKRYTTKETKDFLSRLIAAEIHRENVVKDITRRVFAQFDDSREVWMKAVKCMGTLDVLISLAKFCKSQNIMCRPEVVTSELPFMNMVDGRHPCLDESKFIPNNVDLGSFTDSEGLDEMKGPFLLLTGANMGGKSTIMKQTGLIAILAHMGCYVPAASCVMSVIDRIFTRIGASDNIAEGESTFYVELSETSAILQHASKASMILMDELGRGTATYDGNAIAYAVAQALSERGSRTIFSTHYHTLVAALKNKHSIQVGHMACMVEREVEEGDDPTQETITFLYKLTSGPCGKSYGFNAAKLAGIPEDVIRLAHQKAKDLEASTNKLTLFRKLATKITKSNLTAAGIQQLFSSV